MPDLGNSLQQLLDALNPGRIPSLQRIIASMDPVAWTLLALLLGAIGVGLFFGLTSRRSYLHTDEVESTPDILLARLKQNPGSLPPIAIISRLGADATLELLDYGDQIRNNEWRYKWSGVREELIRQLGAQNAFGPTYALARYYRSNDRQEPETLRIRRTALIYKLGLMRYLEPDADGRQAEMRIRIHPAEVEGDLGFEGLTLWLLPEEPAPPVQGPLIEMEPIEFRTLQDAEMRISIRRSPTVGGGFRLTLNKRHGYWAIVDEEVEWVS
jgi:hypothetical protein